MEKDITVSVSKVCLVIFLCQDNAKNLLNIENILLIFQGVFAFANGLNTKKSKKTSSSYWFNSLFTNEPWYMHYRENWNIFENELKVTLLDLL